jgi:ABC-type Zn2+ transport system substrate-binding protein/surface adhesin
MHAWHCDTGAVEFVAWFFHDCLYNIYDKCGFGLGLVAIAIWVSAQLPQVCVQRFEVHEDTHIHKHARMHARTHSHSHSHTRTPHTHTHTHTHAHTHTHTHTEGETCVQVMVAAALSSNTTRIGWQNVGATI